MRAEPSYIALYQSGELDRRIERALSTLKECTLCPWRCGVDRTAGELGYCGSGRFAHVASFGPHYGEESILVGRGGSGAVFFSGCNLGCIFCQNSDISRNPMGGLEASPEELAGVMLDLQRQGCQNINLVTPSHVTAQILEALPIAIEHGLYLPIIFNTSAFDSLYTLKLFDDVVDLYMPDTKIWDKDIAKRLLGTRRYPEMARKAIKEMHRQVGDLDVKDGKAIRGLLVRHLVMPLNAAGTADWMRWISTLSRSTYINLMDQYHPCAEAHLHPETSRMISDSELYEAYESARQAGFHRYDSEDRLLRRRPLSF